MRLLDIGIRGIFFFFFFFTKLAQLNLFVLFKQLTAISHPFRQENLHNYT